VINGVFEGLVRFLDMWLIYFLSAIKLIKFLYLVKVLDLIQIMAQVRSKKIALTCA